MVSLLRHKDDTRDINDSSLLHSRNDGTRLISRRDLEEEVAERGDIDQLIKSSDLAIHEDFHKAILELVSENTTDIWTLFLDHSSAGHDVLVKTCQLSGTPSVEIRSCIRHLHSEMRAYALIQMEETIMDEFSSVPSDQKSQSYLSNLIRDDMEFRMIYSVWRWCQEGSCQDEKGINDLATQIHQFDHVRNIRSKTMREYSFGHSNFSADMDGKMCEDDKSLIEQLIRIVFSLLRCGRLAEAIELVKSVGAPTLIPAIQMYNMLYDPTMSLINPPVPSQEISKRIFYLQTMSKLIEKREVSPYTRMLWAVLSGRIEPLLSFATRTEDRLWCLTNAAVFARLISAMSGEPISPDVPTTIEAIFSEISTEEKWPYFTVYSMIIRREWAELINWAQEWTETHYQSIDHHFSRFLAQIVVVCKARGMQYTEGSGVYLLEKFIDGIVNRGYFHLIPFYVNYLPKNTRENRLANIMKNITDESSRKEYLEAVKEAAFNSDLLVKRVGESSSQLEDSSISRIDRWKWMLLNGESTLFDTLRQANVLMRDFLINDDDGAAVSVMNESRTHHLLTRGEEIRRSMEEKGKKLSTESLAAYLEHEKYVLFYEAFASCDSFSHKVSEFKSTLHEDRREDSWREMDVVEHTERTVGEQRIEEQKKRAQRTLDVYKARTIELCERFVRHNGWRIETKEFGRSDALRSIRNSCTFCIVELLLQAFENNQDDKSALQVAHLITDGKQSAALDFSKENLRVILSQIHKISGRSLC